MEARETRWLGRGLWSQWYDAARHAGLSNGEACRYADTQDERLRTAERRIEQYRREIRILVELGAMTPPFKDASGV